MPVFVECPSGHRLKVPSKLAGHRIVCPVCNAGFSVAPLPPPPRDNSAMETSAPAIDDPELPTKTKPVASPPIGTNNRAEESSTDIVLDEVSPPTTALRVDSVADESEAGSEPNSELNSGPIESYEAESPSEPVAPIETDLAAQISPDTEPEYAPVDEYVEVPVIESVPAIETESFPVVEQLPLEAYGGPAFTDIPSMGPPTESPEEFEIEQWETNSSYPSPTSVEQHTKPANLFQDEHWGVLVLGCASIAIAIVCAVPSLLNQFHARQTGLNPPDSWTYIVLLGSLLQITIAIYAIRLPDWSTSWMASISATLFSAAYALALSLTMFASQEHTLVRNLGLLDESFRNRSQPWCFLVMCVSLILAYSYGRFSARWYRLHRQLAGSKIGMTS